MTKVYVSSHDKLAARYVASVAREKGFEVVSTWHELPARDHTNGKSLSEKRDIAERCHREIAGADIFVLIPSKDKVPGGKFVEAGIAIGLGKAVVTLGPRENLLMFHPQVRQADEDPTIVLLDQ
jgi:nucleoside 2-deoxyribosyltransferase